MTARDDSDSETDMDVDVMDERAVEAAKGNLPLARAAPFMAALAVRG